MKTRVKTRVDPNPMIGNGKYRCGCEVWTTPQGNLGITWCRTHDQALAMKAWIGAFFAMWTSNFRDAKNINPALNDARVFLDRTRSAVDKT